MAPNVDTPETVCGILNRDLIQLKLVYFTYIAALTVVRPYLALFMSELGLNEFQVGILKSLEPAAIIALSPVWGSIADKLQKRKFLLVVCALGSGVFLPGLLFVPPVNTSEKSSLESSSYISSENSSRESINTPTAEGGITKNELYSATQINLFPATSLFTFSTTAALALCDNVFIAGFLPLFDAHTMAMVNRFPKSSYGGQRWPGALAVILFSPVVGVVTDWYSTHRIDTDMYFLQSEYLPSFILFTLLILVAVVPIINTEDEETIHPPSSFSRELLDLFRNPHVILTFIVFTVAGICKGMVATFTFIFLDELDASKLLMSLSLVATCVVEVPCLLISRKVINRFGYEAIICLGLIAYVIRMVSYSLLENPWYVLPIELLHGVCYGLLWPACTEFAHHIAPEGMASTLQSLTHAAKAGVGEILGIAVGGMIYNLYGARVMYRQAGAITAAVTLIYTIDSLYLHCRSTGNDALDEEKAIGSNPEEAPLVEKIQK